ncbi:phosphodiester glycosidase family protein [bacterium]|nr:phosphodiester glycosidase family protein [bacterium]
MKARWFLPFLVALVITAPPLSHSDTTSVNLQQMRIYGACTYVITANLNDPDIQVKIGLPAKGIPTSESFLSMVKRHSPEAAVTGTYFDTRTLYPVGSIVIEGQPAHESAIGTAVCFTKINEKGYTVTFNATRKGEKFNWSGVGTGLRTGPLLLANGAYALNPAREGFRHPGLFGCRTRMAMGITGYNKLLLVSVSTPITFGRLASVMKSLGATDAVSLDGGTSSAMYYRGKMIRYPGRLLTNIIEVHNHPRVVSQWEMVENEVRTMQGRINSWEPYEQRRQGLTFDEHLPSAIKPLFALYDINEVALAPDLTLAKGRGALIPVNRTHLARL